MISQSNIEFLECWAMAAAAILVPCMWVTVRLLLDRRRREKQR